MLTTGVGFLSDFLGLRERFLGGQRISQFAGSIDRLASAAELHKFVFDHDGDLIHLDVGIFSPELFEYDQVVATYDERKFDTGQVFADPLGGTRKLTFYHECARPLFYYTPREENDYCRWLELQVLANDATVEPQFLEVTVVFFRLRGYFRVVQVGGQDRYSFATLKPVSAEVAER